MPSRDSAQNDRAKSNASHLKSVIEEDKQRSQTHADPAAIVQRTGLDPRNLSARDVMQLQRTIGNQAVGRLMTGSAPIQRLTEEERAANNTGMPDNLKSGIESLSGMAMDDVRVHYNSSKPAQVQALAYAQGTDIHVAAGQEAHLPHEAWHVVQQKQGRVQPPMQLGSAPINDDKGLEQEATSMGTRALQRQAEMTEDESEG